MTDYRIGTAGWAIPHDVAAEFPTSGLGLTRYAARFGCVEINTTFYRPHRPETYVKWAASTPPDFRFAVKAPRAITHHAKLRDCSSLVATFLGEAANLGPKLGPILVQLPPSLGFDPLVAEAFFAALRGLHDGAVACEPRHASWFEPQADALLDAHRIARVAADPAPHPMAALPGGWRGLIYRRLHGSPRVYWSPYAPDDIAALAQAMALDAAAENWCVFDNTASGVAAKDALALKRSLGPRT